jgi:RNA recognition motif-containing protein
MAAAPDVVGNNFIIRYYTVLSRNPDVLHHFYSDRSSRTFGNEGEESAPITSLEEIKKHIDTQEGKETQVLLSTVDCQGSINGGIFISVVGHISQETTRKFTQTFFLEHVDGKYYVLNDIFRYLHSEEQVNDHEDDEEEDAEEPEEVKEKAAEPTPTPNSAPTPAAQPAAPAAAAQAPVSSTTATPAPTPAPVSTPTPTPAPAATATASTQKQEAPLKSEQPHSKSEPANPSQPNAANKPDQQRVPQDKKAEPAKAEGPKSWANIASSQAQTQQPHQEKPQRPHQEKQQSQKQLQEKSEQNAQQEKSARDQHRPENAQSPQAFPKERKAKDWPVLDKDCSIYARALAYNTTAEQLMAAFSPYGKVTNIVLKSTKGFAFIAFDSPQAVQNALNQMKGKSIILPGQSTPLVIEQRKPSKHNAPVTLPHAHPHPHVPSPRGRGRGPPRGASPRVPRDDSSKSFSSTSGPAQGQNAASSTPSQSPSQSQTHPSPHPSHPYPKRPYADRRASGSDFSQSTPPQRHFSSRQQHNNPPSSNKPSV